MEPAIRIENLSKQYRLGTVGTGTLSHDTSAPLSVTPKTLVAPGPRPRRPLPENWRNQRPLHQRADRIPPIRKYSLPLIIESF